MEIKRPLTRRERGMRLVFEAMRMKREMPRPRWGHEDWPNGEDWHDDTDQQRETREYWRQDD